MSHEHTTSSALLDRQAASSSASTLADPKPDRNQPAVATPRQPKALIRSAEATQSSQPQAGACEDQTTWPTWLVLLTITATTVLHAIPWLVDGAAWSGWLGIATALTLVRSGGLGSRFWITWLWCTIALGIAFHWSPAAMAYSLSSGMVLGTIVALPLILWDGLRLALGYWIASRITCDLKIFWLVAALTTIACEYVMPGVFPWKLGFTQLSVPWLIQAVDVFGPSYATLVAFAMGGAIQILGTHFMREATHTFVASRRTEEASVASRTTEASDTLRPTLRSLLLSPVVVFLVGNALYSSFAWQYWSEVNRAAPKLRVALIQVDPSYVESVDNLRKLTAAVADNVDLVCWPESSGGNYDLQLACLADDERNFQFSRDPERGLRPWPTPRRELLLGGKNYRGEGEEPDELYVTAMLIDCGENIVGRYNKRFLMPFGEYVPAESYVPGLAALFDLSDHVLPGRDAQPIPSRSGAKIGAMLCYEDMVPQASRQMVASGSNVLISLINGSAFESPYTLYQHRLISHLRSIECRRSFLRCAATGETCVINALGVVEDRLPMQENDALVASVGLIDGRTIYSRFPWLLPIWGLTVLAFLLHRGNRRKQGTIRLPKDRNLPRN